MILKYTQATKLLDVGCLELDGINLSLKPKAGCSGNLIFGASDGFLQFNYLTTPEWTVGNGAFLPYINNTYDIGSSSYKVANVYATTFQGALNGNAATVTNGAYKTDILCYAGCGIDSTLQKTTGFTMVPAGYSVGMVVDSIIFLPAGAAISGTFKVWYGSTMSVASGTAVVTAGTAISNINVATRVSSFNNATIAKGNIIWVTCSSITTACARIAILIYGHRS